MNRPVEATIIELLAGAPGGRSLSPEQVARAAAGDDWRRLLPHVRATAVTMARNGQLVILRHGKPVDPDAFKGVYRLKAPDGS